MQLPYWPLFKDRIVIFVITKNRKIHVVGKLSFLLYLSGFLCLLLLAVVRYTTADAFRTILWWIIQLWLNDILALFVYFYPHIFETFGQSLFVLGKCSFVELAINPYWVLPENLLVFVLKTDSFLGKYFFHNIFVIFMFHCNLFIFLMFLNVEISDHFSLNIFST